MRKVIVLLLVLIPVIVFAQQQRKWAITVGIGPLYSTGQPEAIESINDSYFTKEFSEDPNGQFSLQAEYFASPYFSIFSDFSSLHYSGNNSQHYGGDYYYTRYQLDYNSLTINARWNMSDSKFVPYLNAGVGVAVGDQIFMTVNTDQVFGVSFQGGLGVRYFFSKKFGVMFEAKDIFVLNTVETEYDEFKYEASSSNLNQYSLTGGIVFSIF